MIKPSFRRAASVAALVLVGPSVRAADIPPLMFGSAWYPEQWPERGWNSGSTAIKSSAH